MADEFHQQENAPVLYTYQTPSPMGWIRQKDPQRGWQDVGQQLKRCVTSTYNEPLFLFSFSKQIPGGDCNAILA